MLNADAPYFKAICKEGYFTKEQSSNWVNVYVFGIQSVTGKILTFHVMTDSGMMRSRVPISELFLKETDNDIPFHFKQLWDCFSENVSVTAYSFLAGNRCEVILRDGKKVWATYMFTVDWFDNPYSNEPSDYKCGHILAADEGYLLCMPNNRIIWKDSNWINKPIEDIKAWKCDTELLSVESVSDKWVTEESCYYYDFKKQ